MKVTDIKTAREAARYCFERGVQVVAIEAGTEGNLLMWHGGEVLLPAIRVRIIDRTGAGDAFTAALAVALVEGEPWEAGRVVCQCGGGPYDNTAWRGTRTPQA